ncbi:nuclear transport factor 2 family protein [Bradyrhizobium sp. AZCC 2289]|uniref:nuclear transport factor 2 family protein n=1 Tax=Bradyrhizobium sp. AZCC 2289 TaxID=3117026 RepID=UPI002FF0E922
MKNSNEKNTVTSANKAKIEAALNALMAGDPTDIKKLLAEDVEWTIPGNSLISGTMHSLAEVSQKVFRPFEARFSRSKDRFRLRKIHGIYADGDTIIAHMDGSGLANDGKPYTNSYVWLLTMRNGKATRVTAFLDSYAVDDLWRRVQPAEN